jgi:hypothetical protein
MALTLNKNPIIGQEAVCPDGLGRVTGFADRFPEQWIRVETYINSRGCKWAPHNVKLVEINYELSQIFNRKV